MKVLGFEQHEQNTLWKLVAVVLHLVSNHHNYLEHMVIIRLAYWSLAYHYQPSLIIL